MVVLFVEFLIQLLQFYNQVVQVIHQLDLDVFYHHRIVLLVELLIDCFYSVFSYLCFVFLLSRFLWYWFYFTSIRSPYNISLVCINWFIRYVDLKIRRSLFKCISTQWWWSCWIKCYRDKSRAFMKCTLPNTVNWIRQCNRC